MNNYSMDLENLSKDELIELCKQMKQSRDKIFTLVSHDLRSPFSGLLGLSEMLASGFDTMSYDERQEYLSAIRDSIRNTYHMLENLFEWGQIERQKEVGTIEAIPIKLVLEEIIDGLSESALNKDIDIIHEYNKQAIINTNSKMIEFVLKAFISNAVKFSNRGSKVILKYEKSSEGHILSVSDQGIGITSENIKKLFSFDSNWKIYGTEGENGIGLGLLVSKRFADYFGADIKVESTAGEGSTFSLIMPELPV